MPSYWKRQKEVNLSMNFSTRTTNAFLKVVDFLGRKLIGYHAILAVKEVFGVSSCHTIWITVQGTFWKPRAVFWDGSEFGAK